MSRRHRTAAATILAGLLLAGCVAPPVPSVTPGRPAPGTVVAPAETPVDLLAARRAAGIEDCPESSTAAAVPGGLPELTLDCLGGDSSVRLAGLRGPLLVNLWAQWCEPCRAEAGHLVAFATTQDEVAVLGINYQDPRPELAIEFAQLVGAKYPQLVDAETTSKGPLGVPGIPLTLLVDAKGRVVARQPGEFTSLEHLQQWVAEGLAR